MNKSTNVLSKIAAILQISPQWLLSALASKRMWSENLEEYDRYILAFEDQVPD